jgi:hypothetical protein
VTAVVFVAVAYAGISGKGTLTKTGGTSYAYSVQFDQAVTGLQIHFKTGVKIASFTAPAGFQCSDAFTMGPGQPEQYNEIDCPVAKAAANQAIKGTVKLSKSLASGEGATLYQAGAKLNAPVGPFPITGP